MTIFNKKKFPGLLGLGLNFEVVCAFGFLTNFCVFLDFGVLDPNLNIIDSRLLKFSKKRKFGAPNGYVQYCKSLLLNSNYYYY
jgi:hypothetical protein